MVSLRPHEVDLLNSVLLLDKPPESTPEYLMHKLRVVSSANEAFIVDVEAVWGNFGLNLWYLFYGSHIELFIELITV